MLVQFDEFDKSKGPFTSHRPTGKENLLNLSENLNQVNLTNFFFQKFRIIGKVMSENSMWTYCHQYFLITISSTQCTPVSSWSNRPLLSGGNSSCSWVFYLCTGPKVVNPYTAGRVSVGLHLCQSRNALLWVPSRVHPQKDTNKQLFM